MKPYKTVFREEDSSVKFVKSLPSISKTKFVVSEYFVFEADYDSNKDEIISNYSKLENKKINVEEDSAEKAIRKTLAKLGPSYNYQYEDDYIVENGYCVIRVYHYKNEPLALRKNDKNFKRAMLNNYPLIQELIILNIKEVRAII